MKLGFKPNPIETANIHSLAEAFVPNNFDFLFVFTVFTIWIACFCWTENQNHAAKLLVATEDEQKRDRERKSVIFDAAVIAIFNSSNNCVDSSNWSLHVLGMHTTNIFETLIVHPFSMYVCILFRWMNECVTQ